MERDSITLPLKRGKSVTLPQVLLTPTDLRTDRKSTLPSSYSTNWTTTVRAMRKDPTLSMVRQLIIAPALMSPWQYKARKGAPKDAETFIEEQIDELRTYLLRTVLFGCIDFGWAPFEKVYEKNDDGKIILCKMKALLQDYTDILVKPDTGAFAGLLQVHPMTGGEIILLPQKCWFHSFDVEGTYWYGKGWMENAEEPYEQWLVTNAANQRYDKKIAGSHWVVHYPVGISMVGGAETSNEIIAQQILGALQSSGGIAVPKKAEEFLSELDKDTPNAWEIELISDKGAQQVGFIERLTYLDKLKVRALGFPERSILEGKYGTKAEAETHADFAVSNILMRTHDILRDLNWHLVDPLLAADYGPEARGKVRLVNGAIGEENKRFLRDMYMKLFADSKGFISEVYHTDLEQLRELLAIPVDPDKDDDIFETLHKGLEDELRDTGGRRDPVWDQQSGQVGRPEQQRESSGNKQPDRLGALASRRKDQQPPTEK